ncbi:MAG TPA: RNA-binding cell elongation regulator Jag/EloR [Dehalococcoidia bacterium]|nr:RNA-binding cell elongation regulator Jag/EloR [Dehalococcoidia bacterium]
MAGVEASGKTVEEAIESALSELGAEREDVEIEVLTEAKGGILGVGAAQARVRVWRKGEEPEDAPPAEGDEEYIEDEAEIAAQALDKLLAMMGIEADVSIRDPETPGDGLGMAKAVLDVEGDDLGLLIGRRGETLASLQYLLNLMMTRQFSEHMSFTIDIEGYRRRREQQLNTLAHRMADQVRRTRRPVTLEPMPANERRIIHLALAEDRQVETSSFGEGESRKISISPRR